MALLFDEFGLDKTSIADDKENELFKKSCFILGEIEDWSVSVGDYEHRLYEMFVQNRKQGRVFSLLHENSPRKTLALFSRPDELRELSTDYMLAMKNLYDALEMWNATLEEFSLEDQKVLKRIKI